MKRKYLVILTGMHKVKLSTTVFEVMNGEWTVFRLERFSNESRRTRQKSLRLSTKNTERIVDLSELEVHAYSPTQSAGKHISERVTICFGFYIFDWMKKQREFCKPCNGVMQKWNFT